MNRQHFTVVMVGLVVFLIMLTINILQLGDRDFISATNNLSLLVFGVFATGQAFIYWIRVHNREEARHVWLVLGLGMLFYSLGQLTWMIYNWIGVEVPYPSLGDLFWILAYPCLFIALRNKIRLLGVVPSKGQVVSVVAIATILFMMIGYFILLPMVGYIATARVVETVLNFFYPLMDFLILVIVSFLVIILWKGQLSLSWNFLAIGFFILAIADVLFGYATWNELYYAESGSVSLLTRSIDVAYNLAVFLLAVGVYLHQWVVHIEQDVLEFEFIKNIRNDAKPQTFTSEMQKFLNKTFFMVDFEQNVYFYSQYYRELCLLLGDNSGHVVGATLASVLGIEKQNLREIFSDAHSGKTNIVPIEIVIGTTRIPTIMKVSPARNGSDVFLSYWHEGALIKMEETKPIEDLLTDEYLQSVRGLQSASSDVRGATAFFLIEVQEMYLFLVRMGGYRIAETLVEKFNQLAASQQAGVKIADGRVVLSDVLESKSMAKLLQLTLKTVQEMTSAEATSKVVKQLNEKIPEGIIRSAQNAGLAL